MKLLLTLLFTLSSLVLISQPKIFETGKGHKHIIGAFDISILEQDSIYSIWFKKNYENYHLSTINKSIRKGLKDVQVEIFLGTWCGDSKYLVPRFIKLWDQLGLKRNQLNLIGLYNSAIDGKYKQGPNGEEENKYIHRVPTFIFKRDGVEFARIVEHSRNDLYTDVSQISLGFPSKPNYRIANYILALMDTLPPQDIRQNLDYYIRSFYDYIGKSGELNTLGYVLLDKGEVEKAILVFEVNTHLFRYTPNVYDSYAEALALSGETDKAIHNYEKVLELDPKNENAKIQLDKLKPKLP